MIHRRYLTCIGRTVVDGNGTLNEAHTAIVKRNRSNGFRSTYDVIDTWNEPGHLEELKTPSGRVVNLLWIEE